LDPGKILLDNIILTQSRETEKISWSMNLNAAIRSTPAISTDGKIFVGSNNNKFSAIDAKTQSVAWSFQLTQSVQSSPLIVNNLVIFGANDNYVYAMEEDPSDGIDNGYIDGGGTQYDIVWRFQTGGMIRGSPAYSNGIVYIASSDGMLYALDINGLLDGKDDANPEVNPSDMGDEIWAFSTPYQISSTPIIDNGKVFIGANPAGLYDPNVDYIFALSASMGEIIWSDNYHCNFVTSMAVSDGFVFMGCSQGNHGILITYDEDGDLDTDADHDGLNMMAKILWTYSGDDSPIGRIESAPAISENIVYFGNDDHNLYALDEFTGIYIWSQATNGAILSSPSISNSFVFVGSDDKNVYAFNKDDGSIEWSIATNGMVRTSPDIIDLDCDGQLEIVVGSDDGKIYSIKGAGESFKREQPWTMYRHDLNRTGVSQWTVKYLPTDPMNPDTDFDALSDIMEFFGYFGFERVEMEDVLGYGSTDGDTPFCPGDVLAELCTVGFKAWAPAYQSFIHQTGVTLITSTNNYPNIGIGNADYSWVKVGFKVMDTGQYKLMIKPNDNIWSVITTDYDGHSDQVIYRNKPIDNEIANYAKRILRESFKISLMRGGHEIEPVPGSEEIIPDIYEVVFPDGANHNFGPVDITGWVSYSAEFNLSRDPFPLSPTSYEIKVSLDLSKADLTVHPELNERFPWLLRLIKILDLDYLRIEKRGLNPLNADADNDGLSDGYEATSDRYPLNCDADHDGLSDMQEKTLGTNPGYRDTDLDGLRDGIELDYNNNQLEGQTSSKASWTERIARDPLHDPLAPHEMLNFPNYDQNPSPFTNTDPLNSDTDHDGLPDGWRDGWTYNPSQEPPKLTESYDMNTLRYKNYNYWRYDVSLWGQSYDKIDNKIQIWEGEDLNLDGDVQTGPWGFEPKTYEAIVPVPIGHTGAGQFLYQWNGESYSNAGDSEDTDHNGIPEGDGVPDGYEAWFSHLDPIFGSDGNYILDPTVDDHLKDADSSPNELVDSGYSGASNEYFDINEDNIALAIQIPPVNNPTYVTSINVDLNLKFDTPALLELWETGTPGNPNSIADIKKPIDRDTMGPFPIASETMNGRGFNIYKFDIKDQTLKPVDADNQGRKYYLILWYVDEATHIDGSLNPGYSWAGVIVNSNLNPQPNPIAKCYFWDTSHGQFKQADNAHGYPTIIDKLLFSLDTAIETPDGLTNLQEYLIGSNPKNPDTDSLITGNGIISDGLLDGVEILNSYICQGSQKDNDGIFASIDDYYLKTGDISENVEVNDITGQNNGQFFLVNQWDQITFKIKQGTSEYSNKDITFIIRAIVEGSSSQKLELNIYSGTDPNNFPNPEDRKLSISRDGTFISINKIGVPDLSSSTFYIRFEKKDITNNHKIAFDSFSVIINGEDNAMVILRTNVPNGAASFNDYGKSGQYIDYDGDSALGLTDPGSRYIYVTTLIDPEINFGGKGGEDEITPMMDLYDGTGLYLNRSQVPWKLYVWAPKTDFMDQYSDINGIKHLEGKVHIFERTTAIDVASEILSDYWNQEVYMSNPFLMDTDLDGIMDGYESGLNHPNIWREDWDQKRDVNGNIVSAPDQVPCVRDMDSDNDGRTDREFDYNMDLPGPNGDSPNRWFTDSFDFDNLENMIDFDSDGDGLADGKDSGSNMIYADSDGDGLVDGYIEGFIWDDTNHRFSEYPNVAGSQPFEGEDLNLNGIKEKTETDPKMQDTDKDGLWDGFDHLFGPGESDDQYGEMSEHHGYLGTTDPLNPDTDGDRLKDGLEVRGWTLQIRTLNDNLDGLVYDTIKSWSNPVDSADTDGDGVSDKEEYQRSDATESDTDDDGLSDLNEKKDGTLPFDADTDSDDLIDGFVSGSTMAGEDYHNQGVIDNDEPIPTRADSDGEGINDGVEYQFLKNLKGNGYYDSDGNGYIDLKQKDSDNDGLTDGQENYIINDKIDTITVDNVEYKIETDPTDPDSDNDGLMDGAEPLPFTNEDGDLTVNAWDYDSNYAGPSNTPDYYDVFVTFRTNQVDTNKDGKIDYTGGWISVDPNAAVSSLGRYDCGVNLDSLSGDVLDLHVYSYASGQTNPQDPSHLEKMYTSYFYDPNEQMPFDTGWSKQILTPDGYEVLYDTVSTDIYIKISSTKYVHYESGVQGDGLIDDNINPEPMVVNTPNGDGKAPESSFINRHQETYDPRPALGVDKDFDGLSDMEEDRIGTNKSDPDSDDDGIPDGKEMNYQTDTDHDGPINAKDKDSDNDGLTDSQEDLNKNGIVDAGETSPINPDFDNDGLVDGNTKGKDEYWFDSNSNTVTKYFSLFVPALLYESKIDENQKTLYRYFSEGEQGINTNNLDSDTDDDGLYDGFELATDFDTIKDGKLTTSPTSYDTDGDKLPDGLEYGITKVGKDTDLSVHHFWPDADSTTSHNTNPTQPDSDYDGLNDNIEDKNMNGAVDAGETNPNNADTDGDHLPDGWIDGWGYRNGNWGIYNDLNVNADVGEFEDRNLNGIVDIGDWNDGIGPGETNPLKSDTDGDGLIDGPTLNSIFGELSYNFKGTNSIGAQSKYTNPLVADSDNDGATDYQEVIGWSIDIYYEQNPNDVKETRYVTSNPTVADTDIDGLTDGIELFSKSDPTSTDTDGDHISDFDELNFGSSLSGIECQPPIFMGLPEDPNNQLKVNIEIKLSPSGVLDLYYPSGWIITFTVHVSDGAGISKLTADVSGTTTSVEPPASENGVKDFVTTLQVEKPYDGSLILKGKWKVSIVAIDLNGNKGEIDKDITIQEVVLYLIVNAVNLAKQFIEDNFHQARDWLEKQVTKMFEDMINWAVYYMNQIPNDVSSWSKKYMSGYMLSYIQTHNFKTNDDLNELMAATIPTMNGPTFFSAGYTFNNLYSLLSPIDFKLLSPPLPLEWIIDQLWNLIVMTPGIGGRDLAWAQIDVDVPNDLITINRETIASSRTDNDYFMNSYQREDVTIPSFLYPNVIVSPTIGQPELISLDDNPQLEILVKAKTLVPDIYTVVIRPSLVQNPVLPRDQPITFPPNLINVQYTTSKSTDISSVYIYRLVINLPNTNINAYTNGGLYDLELLVNGLPTVPEMHSIKIYQFFPTHFNFAQITDIHIGRMGTDLDLSDLIWDISHTGRVGGIVGRPEFIVITGDIVNGGFLSTFWQDKDWSFHTREEEYIAFYQAVLTSPIPIFVIPGNHDYFAIPFEDFYPHTGLLRLAAYNLFILHVSLATYQNFVFDSTRTLGNIDMNLVRTTFNAIMTRLTGLVRPLTPVWNTIRTIGNTLINDEQLVFNEIIDYAQLHMMDWAYNLDKYHQYLNPGVYSMIDNNPITLLANPNDYFFDLPIHNGNVDVNLLFIFIDSGHGMGAELETTLVGLDDLQLTWIQALEQHFTIGVQRPHIFLFSHAPIFYSPGVLTLPDPPIAGRISWTDDPTHALNHDENFIAWIVNEDPLFEVSFAGHTHLDDQAYIDINMPNNIDPGYTDFTITMSLLHAGGPRAFRTSLVRTGAPVPLPIHQEGLFYDLNLMN